MNVHVYTLADDGDSIQWRTSRHWPSRVSFERVLGA